MNDINELLDIIASLGGSASINEITSAYAKKYKMPKSLISKGVIVATLKQSKSVAYSSQSSDDSGLGTWTLVTESSPSNIFLSCGYRKTKEGVHATEFSLVDDPNVVVYLLPNKTISVVINPQTDARAYNGLNYSIYHNSNMTKFPVEKNNGKQPIHFGLKIEFEESGNLLALLTSIKKYSSINLTGEYLLLSENRYFKTIKETMLAVFNKHVSPWNAYFSVDKEHSAWFPQPNNDNWENSLSEDGMVWYEKPKNITAEYEPDFKLRYVFVHEKDGYRFTGVFKYIGMDDQRKRQYQRVDDKVLIVESKKAMVICRVAYMKYYDGISAEDTPVNGGSYVSENNDAFEKYNFHKYEDGYCYGFIETKYKAGHTADNKFARAIAIEKINPSCKDKPYIDGVRVVLVAFSPVLKKTVVVGWYDNATVYRNRVIEDEKIYMSKCACEDAHLIPHNERTFEVPKAGGSNEFGIGQSNFWYIQRFEVANEFEKKLTNYLDEMYS